MPFDIGQIINTVDGQAPGIRNPPIAGDSPSPQGMLQGMQYASNVDSIKAQIQQVQQKMISLVQKMGDPYINDGRRQQIQAQIQAAQMELQFLQERLMEAEMEREERAGMPMSGSGSAHGGRGNGWGASQMSAYNRDAMGRGDVSSMKPWNSGG